MRNIKVLLHGMPYHTKVFEEQLREFSNGIFEPVYCENLSDNFEFTHFDLFHLISTPLPTLKKFVKYNKPVFYHWIGTDVYRILNDFYIKRWMKKRLIAQSGIFNLVVSESLKIELAQIGISSEILPLVNLDFVKECPPFPEKYSVLTYIPRDRWDFYHGDLIMGLARELPDVDFHILAVGDISQKPDNVFTYGFIDDVAPFYKNSCVLIRLTTHDGLPKMILEALSYGRQVLWSEKFPYSYFVKNQDDCMEALISLKSNISINQAGKEFVETHYHPQKICSDYLTLCRKLIESK